MVLTFALMSVPTECTDRPCSHICEMIAKYFGAAQSTSLSIVTWQQTAVIED